MERDPAAAGQENMRGNMDVRADRHHLAGTDHAKRIDPDVAPKADPFHADQHGTFVNENIFPDLCKSEPIQLFAGQEAGIPQHAKLLSVRAIDASTMPAISSAVSAPHE